MKLFLPFGKGLASFVYTLSRCPLSNELFVSRQSRTKTDIGVPIRRKFIQVQSEASTPKRTILPVSTANRSNTHTGQPLYIYFSRGAWHVFAHPPIMRPISSSRAVQISYFLKFIYSILNAILTNVLSISS